MSPQSISLIVYFEGPFWVGVFEEAAGRELRACRFLFGAEPKDAEVLERILRDWGELEFSPAVAVRPSKTETNPKRRQREAGRLLDSRGPGTKSRKAVALAREASKQERLETGRREREARKTRLFELKRKKRKKKHRGR